MSNEREAMSQTNPHRKSCESCSVMLELREDLDEYIKRTDARLADGSAEMNSLAVEISELRKSSEARHIENSGLSREILGGLNALNSRVASSQFVAASVRACRDIETQTPGGKMPELKLPGGSVKGPAWVITTVAVFGIVFLGIIAGVAWLANERFKQMQVQTNSGK